LSEGFIDNFSYHSKEYSFSRPTYPDLLFEFLATVTPQKILLGIVQQAMDRLR